MMADPKLRPLSLGSRCGAPLEPFADYTVATVSAFWLRVGTVMVNLLKTSVMTNIFSRPSEDDSNTVKSIAITSN